MLLIKVSRVVAFNARLAFPDVNHLDNTTTVQDESSVHSFFPLHVCIQYPYVDNCFAINPLHTNVQFNFGLITISNSEVVNVVLCRKKNLNYEVIIDPERKEQDQLVFQNITNMRECLNEHVEDSITLYLKSPSFNNNMTKMLMRKDDLYVIDQEVDLSKEEEEKINFNYQKPVGLLISTLDGRRYKQNKIAYQNAMKVQDSLLSYFLSFSNNVYILVPDYTDCLNVFGISVTCCSLNTSGIITQ